MSHRRIQSVVSVPCPSTGGPAYMRPPAAPAAPPVEVLTPKGVREPRAAGDVRAHDFRQSGFLAASELRRGFLR